MTMANGATQKTASEDDKQLLKMCRDRRDADFDRVYAEYGHLCDNPGAARAMFYSGFASGLVCAMGTLAAP